MTRYALDVAALHRTLDERRRRAGLSWRQVAAEVGVSPSTLTRLGDGKCPDAAALCGLVMWLGLSLRQFVRRAGGDGG
jgi:transcriptional regulator with XRE-family HTH domain